MSELFFGLYNLVIVAALGRWFEVEHAGRVRPFTISVFYFFFAIGCILVAFSSNVATTKVVFGAFACNWFLVSAMYRLENDHEKFQQGAGVWVKDLTILMGVTGFLTMAMDYSNTKVVLNTMLLVFAASIVPVFFRMWKGKGRREADL